mgnify:CR=1 FL=1
MIILSKKNKFFADDGWAFWIDGDDTSTIYLNNWLNPKGTSYVDVAIHIRGIKEIYCYLETPPTLAWNGSNRINPTVYVPLEYYAIYISAPIWKEFTIKAIM